jgi:hypothetical protein
MTALMIAAVGIGHAAAQQSNTPPVSKAVYWSSAEPRAEIYLVGNEGGGDLRLTVISKRELKVIYHTRINSSEEVEKELTPAGPETEGVRSYEFHHVFSRMTIWMSLEFQLDGKTVPGLTRTFYNDIFSVVPNGHLD